jgi:hypothetical protein
LLLGDVLYFIHCLNATKKSKKVGKTIPSSLGIVLWFDNSTSENSRAQTIKEEIIALKLKRETFRNLTLIGTKKKIITIKLGTKNGYTNIL